MTPGLRIEWLGPGAGPEFDAAAPSGYPPEPIAFDATGAVAWRGDEPVARLATYLRDDLRGAPGRSGLVGHYGARDAEAGVAILNAASAELRRAGATRVIGPMNGSTWQRYRLALPHEPGDREEPPFLGEPQNPAEYHGHFVAAGFTPVAWYESRVARDVAAENPRAPAAEAAAATRGVQVEPMDMTRFDEELLALYDLSVRAFADNPYYSPIEAAEFAAMYAPMKPMLDPDLVLLARARDGVLAGYVFGYRDSLAPGRLIVKTVAVDPAWRSVGLGGLLVGRLHAAARAKAFGSVVHALMHVANPSLRISTHTAERFRTYALYERPGERAPGQ